MHQVLKGRCDRPGLRRTGPGPDRDGHCEDAPGDADSDALEGPAAVLFQVELAFEGVVDRFDELGGPS
jgi:hypothetical protein